MRSVGGQLVGAGERVSGRVRAYVSIGPKNWPSRSMKNAPDESHADGKRPEASDERNVSGTADSVSLVVTAIRGV